MHQLYDFLLQFFIFFAFIYSIYFFVKGRNILAIRFFSLHFFVIALILTLFIFFHRDNLLKYPYTFRTISPLIYLLPPLGYLSFLYFFFPNKQFNKLHFLFFIPFLFQLLENTQYYFASYEDKINEVKLYIQTGDLFYHSSKFVYLNPLYHVYFKVFLYFLFSSLTIKNLVKFLQGKLVFNPWKSKKITYWILGMIVLRSISNLFLLYRYIINYQPSISPTGLEWLLSIDACFSILFLIFNPDILDFHYLKEYQKSIESSNGSGNSEEDSYQIHCENVCKEINQILEVDHYFTKSECTVENIYLQSKIPQRVISFSFRQVYGMSIKDFINKKRVDYLIELYKADDLLKKYSLDYLGELAGFHSRQTLYSCTEKFYGCTPKALFDKVSLQEL